MTMNARDRHDEDQELMRRRRSKNWALAAALVAFVVIVYFVSLVRMGGL